ncbi:MAG TPA: calcium-translocating P-type ATPase, PMCA-type [Bacteroidales bacterium]|nr:calcium-translocating P-type ATPase, PMCA-type [Bacteroidales bacterium]
MAQIYNQDLKTVIENLETDATNGLTTREAEKRINEYGLNKIRAKKRKSFSRMFFEQFRSFMIIILLIAAGFSGVVGVMEGEGIFDTLIILIILFINALIGAIQERKAESSLEALINLAAPETKILRDGTINSINTEQLVPGDIVILETGAIIPADIRITEAINLKVQESSLTGESVPVEKQTDPLAEVDIPLGDRTNMAFSSGMVTYGRGRGIVVKTGMETEVGKIAGMLSETADTGTPMSRRLEDLGKMLGIAALIICAVIFIVGLIYGNSIISMFMTAVSLAVAAIPEGLPAVSTVVLAIGVQRMVKRNAIIRTLPAVETLGSATIICSDKTGTLTQNRMTVVETYFNNKNEKVEVDGSGNEMSHEKETLIHTAVLCADVHVSHDGDNTILKGDPTETALVSLGMVYGFDKKELESKYERISEIPFDSKRKRMTTVNRINEKTYRIFVKGGLDEILHVCDKITIDGKIRPIEPDDLKKIRSSNEEMANTALRVLAMAYRDLEDRPENNRIQDLESGLIFTGMVGMIDPARPEVIEAVKKCNTAGIRPVMITGDHKNTALAIAREIGIYREGDLVITGSELEKISDEVFRKDVSKYSVYARVAPEHKVRIVKAWQSNYEIVAMTGDGVNDAPALKQADIGAAMGIVGTDVAKGAADMVLTDDNFATIVNAIEEGRRIYDNIKKAIQFLLSTNIGEIFLLFVTSVFNMGIPLLPVHILWVNLVTDSLPALALSVDPAEKDIMTRKPRKAKKGFLTGGMIWRIMYQGIMIGSIPLIAYIAGLREGNQGLARTMAFSTLMFAQLVHVRNLHSITTLSFKISPLKNKPLIAAILISAFLALAVLLIPPLREAFSLVEMDRRHWVIVILMSLIPIIFVDLFKMLKINGSGDEDSA